MHQNSLCLQNVFGACYHGDRKQSGYVARWTGRGGPSWPERTALYRHRVNKALDEHEPGQAGAFLGRSSVRWAAPGEGEGGGSSTRMQIFVRVNREAFTDCLVLLPANLMWCRGAARRPVQCYTKNELSELSYLTWDTLNGETFFWCPTNPLAFSS